MLEMDTGHSSHYTTADYGQQHQSQPQQGAPQQQQQQQGQQPGAQQSQQQWPLLQSAQHNAVAAAAAVGPSPFQSPAPSVSQLDHAQSYSGFFHGHGHTHGHVGLAQQQQQQQQQQSHHGQHPGHPHQHQHQHPHPERQSSLSLNISSLSVTSPTTLSPITPSPHPSTASTTLSPVTPLSPSSANTTPQQHAFPPPSVTAAQQARHATNMFAYAPPDHGGGVRYDHTSYDIAMHRSTTSSRSSSSSEKSIPRKRSFTSGSTPLPVSMEEDVGVGIYDASAGSAVSASLELNPASFEEVDMGGYTGMDSQGSPIDGGSSSGGEPDDPFKSAGSVNGLGHTLSTGNTNDITQNVGIIGSKTSAGTNNFVTKLYQMISDPKSSHFISWTDLGTSFVVSNVGEFSRTILGSHFKHNNFSSFVRQLNMYGFHKINRTPRAQRTSTDAQTWEFSHHKFLRGRPDLLDEIKRKALEPDPSIKHRVELPGEVAAQLSQMREQNRRVVKALEAERGKVERLTSVTKTLHEFISKAFPGQLPHFPPELWETNENPPIFITSPTSATTTSRYTSAMTLPSSFHNLHSFSPSSSPTNTDFPPPSAHHTHAQHTHSIPRTHSLQHIPYDTNGGYATHGISTARYESALSTPLPPSPGGAFDALESASDRKRQRTGSSGISSSVSALAQDNSQTKRLSRARSDSAPLGYGINQPWAHGSNRPRSGSGLAPRPSGRRDDLLVNISGTAHRNANGPHSATPLLNVSPVNKGHSGP